MNLLWADVHQTRKALTNNCFWRRQDKKGLSPRKTRYVCLPFGFEGSGGDASPIDKRFIFRFLRKCRNTYLLFFRVSGLEQGLSDGTIADREYAMRKSYFCPACT